MANGRPLLAASDGNSVMSEVQKGSTTQAMGQVYFQEKVAGAAVRGLLAKLFAHGAFWLGTTAEHVEVGYGEAGPAIADLLATWGEGRAFDRQTEVRWAWQGKDEAGAAHYRVWLLSEGIDGAREELRQALALQALGDGWRVAVGSQSMYLWGQYMNDLHGWVEVRVPRILHYPVSGAAVQEKSFAGVDYVLYCAPNGAVQFTRLTGVVSRAA